MPELRKRWIGIALGGLALAAAVVAMLLGAFRDDSGVDRPLVDQDGSVSADKSHGFALVRRVFGQGGTHLEIEEAISHLDEAARTRRGLAPGDRAWLVEAMAGGAPPGVRPGTWSHIFNSACNALARGEGAPDEAFFALLLEVAAADPDKVLRLYALQHLGVHYPAAPEPWQERMRDLVAGVIDDPMSETAGTALVLWQNWHHDEPESGRSPAVLAVLALAVAADAGRPADVRISALHSAGDDPQCLDLSRTIAADPAEPVLLRKAAMNLIGRHGGDEDIELLQAAAGRNPRLQQASEPALAEIDRRLSGRPAPNYQPYR